MRSLLSSLDSDIKWCNGLNLTLAGDANVFDILIDNSANSGTLIRLDKNYPLMPFTETELNDFHVPMNFIKRNKMTQITMLKGLHKKASDLMKLLQEKYNVNQE